jgi:hypothetical protein
VALVQTDMGWISSIHMNKRKKIRESITFFVPVNGKYISYYFEPAPTLNFWNSVTFNESKNGSPGDFLNLFTVCSLCKRKFVVCLFVDEEANGSYPFPNGQNGLAPLWVHRCTVWKQLNCMSQQIIARKHSNNKRI